MDRTLQDRSLTVAARNGMVFHPLRWPAGPWATPLKNTVENGWTVRYRTAPSRSRLGTEWFFIHFGGPQGHGLLPHGRGSVAPVQFRAATVRERSVNVSTDLPP